MLRHVRGPLALAVAAVVGLLGVGFVTQATSAAWTDSASFSAAVTAGSWATATASPPVTAGDGVSITTTWTQANNTSDITVCAQIVVSTTSTTPVPWSVVVHTDVIPWNGKTSGYRNGNANYTYAYGTPSADAVTVTGGSGDNTTVVRGQDRSVVFCNDHLAPIPPDQAQGWYTASATPSGTAGCVTTTVTPKSRAVVGHDFYFAWSVPVDMSAAFRQLGHVDQVRADAASWVTFSPGLSPQTTAYQATVNTAGYALQAGGPPVSFVVCGYRYS